MSIFFCKITKKNSWSNKEVPQNPWNCKGLFSISLLCWVQANSGPLIDYFIWNFASSWVVAFICSIFITKLWTLDCCLAIMIVIKFWNIFRNYWKVADTLLVLTDISFSPPSCNYPSTSPEMIGSCYHQTPCDHIYLSFWPRLPFPPSFITSSIQCIIVGWGW